MEEKTTKLWTGLRCILVAAIPAAMLFTWAFVKWKIALYGLSAALLGGIAAALFTLLARSAKEPSKRPVLKIILATVAYLLVTEALTYGINNMLFGGGKPYITAAVITLFNFVLYLAVSLRTASKNRLAFGWSKKTICILLCACQLLAGAFPIRENLMDYYFMNSKKMAPVPVELSKYTPPQLTPADDADFYVSPTGSDANDGTFASPFATPERARDAVRTMDKSGKKKITVAFMGGEYRIDGLQLTAEDGGAEACPVEWRAYDTTEVIFNGGVSLDPAAFGAVSDEKVLSRLTDEAKANVKCLDLGTLGITAEQYGKIYTVGSYNTAKKYSGDWVGPLYAELFIDDTRCALARYPDTGWLKTGEVVSMGKGLESNGSTTKDPDYENRLDPESDVYKVDKALADRINGWATFDDVWMFGFWKYTWADASTPIGAFDYEKRTLSPKFVSLYGAIKDAPYYFFNVLEELTAPGEWYLDRENGVLYVYPPEGFGTASVDLTLSTAPLISAEGLNWFTLRGVTLKGTRSNALELKGDHITVAQCLIKNVAGDALLLTGSSNLASDNEITHTGKGGITLTGGDIDSLTPGSSAAVNNLIHDWSEIYQTYQAAVLLQGMGNRCAHNEIYNSPHEAITYTGNSHLVEYNLIHDVCLISDDAGAIYAGRSWSMYGNVIRYNAIFNLGTPGEHSPQGIYLDDALGGQTVYGNLLVNVPCYGLQLGGGRDLTVQNNIVINTKKSGVSYDQRAVDGVLKNGWFGHCDEMWEELNTHPWQSEAWQKAYPQLVGLHFDPSRTDDPMFVANAANSKVTGNVFINERCALGEVEENPRAYSDISGNAVYRLSALNKLFEDPENGNYNLKADSPVFTEIPDFEPLPLDKIGRVN